MGVVGRGLQADGFDGLHHGPVALACDQGRGGLHHGVAAGGQALVQQGIEAVGEQLADGEIGRVGEIDDDHVEGIAALLQPVEGIGIEDVHARIAERFAVEPAQHGVVLEQVGHGRVQLHQGDRLHRGVLEHLAHGHAVAAAQHGHALGRAMRGHHGVDQGLVVAVLVALRELQVAVEVQPRALAPLRHHDALVGRAAGEHDAVLVEMVVGQARQMVGAPDARAQQGQHGRAGQGMGARAPQFMPKQQQCPDRHRRIHEAEQQPRAHQAQLGHQQQRKCQRHGQRAQVVEGQHLGHQVLERHIALEDAHHQRNLQPHQRAHHQHHAVQQEPERAGRVGIGNEQRGRQRTADQGHHQLDAQKVRRQVVLEIARQPGAYAHGEQVAADDGGELQDRIAQQIGSQRTRSQFVKQAAGRDHEDADQQGDVDGTRRLRAGKRG